MRNYITILFVLLGTNLFAQTFTDIDLDDDGLIEVNDLETLNAMRYQLDGSGLQLDENAVEITTGCAPGGCKGYELTQDLDFNSADSYQDIANLERWADGAGWQPIGDATHPLTAIFKTNNGSTPNVIYNLTINRPGDSGVGLFGHIGSGAKISGIGLLNAEITGHSQVGGLVGKSAGGNISNSYVSGRVVGEGAEVGLLIGNSSGAITNSYANGEVFGGGNGIGGLVGASSGSITNSYAVGSVVGAANHVGGLVGDNSQGTISNCYTTGSVSGSEDIGGLVGISSLGKLIGNYVSGKTLGKRYIGGLVGINVGGTITRSYWDKTTNKLTQNTGGVGLSASELQSQSAQDDDLSKPYYKWSNANWDFGTAEQYPILKYATGSDAKNPACGPGQTLPNCGAVLLGQHASLERIMFSQHVGLNPTFKPTQLNYQLDISPRITQLQLVPIASNPASTIHISRNGVILDENLAAGTTSSVITLGHNTSITIAVSAPKQRPAQYQFSVKQQHTITLFGIPNEVIDEGELIILDAFHSLDVPEDQVSYRWTQTTGKTILPETDNQRAALFLSIPEDYVSITEDDAELGLNIAVTDGKTTVDKDISLMIAKRDNGTIAVGLPSLSFLELTAPEIDLSKDPDGAGQSFSHQWQHRLPSAGGEWTNLDGATERTHTISFLAEWYTEYRVLINYTDGQGYQTTEIGEAIAYTMETAFAGLVRGAASEESYPAISQRSSQTSPATVIFDCNNNNDIDDDNDGLIEICNLEGLNAIRYQLDGSGYRVSASAAKITTGCPDTTGCTGYELTRDLDFNKNDSYSSTNNKVMRMTGAGWEPIGDSFNAFNATFYGNGHSISNLMIKRPSKRHVGLFSSTGRTAKISNFSLLNINIKGEGDVGGLAGFNHGTITTSTITGSIEGNYNIGGLVGYNHGVIENSEAQAEVSGADWVGGLVGSNRGAITRSKAQSKVIGTHHVGGLVGDNYATIKNSEAQAEISGTDWVGGLVGSNFGSIIDSNTTGKVGREAGSRYVGGLVGDNYNAITDSYATGKVFGRHFVGGLVGRNNPNASIAGSYATGNVRSREAVSYVGGLAGYNYGSIINSHATGGVRGRSAVGGLVGINSAGAFITNSYVISKKMVSGYNHVGGLVGWNSGFIDNSYAVDVGMNSHSEGTVVAKDLYLGGLAGRNSGRIKNSYATGAIAGTDLYVGGLVGRNSGDIKNSYAKVAVKGEMRHVGGLVGQDFGTITNSYWEKGDDNIMTRDDELGKTMTELQSPTEPGTTSADIYYGWLSDNWHFGTAEQYPVLRYAKGADEDNEACRNPGQAGTDLPICGHLLSPIARGLSELRLIARNLSPDFNTSLPHYRGHLVGSTSTVRFIPVAITSGTTITIEANGQSENLNSNIESRVIVLDPNGITEINITVDNGDPTLTVRYILYLSYYAYEGSIDSDKDGLIDISDITQLNAMRYQLDGTSYRANVKSPKITIGCPNNQCTGYELMRDLDFDVTDDSYTTAHQVVWTVDNHRRDKDQGWQPIGDKGLRFNTVFEGNGYNISNLSINRDAGRYIGLFGHIGSHAKIRNVGLLNVNIEGRNNVGGLVGVNRGEVDNSYTSGAVKGIASIGGLVGSNTTDGLIANSYSNCTINEAIAIGQKFNFGGLVGTSNEGSEIINSYATGAVWGNAEVGGLVGTSNGGSEIINSYATGAVWGNAEVGGLVGTNRVNSKIINSYALGAVMGNAIVGGLVGWNTRVSKIYNSYAIGAVTGNYRIGGLVGDNGTDGIVNDSSYWNTDTSPLGTAGIGQNTAALQSPTAPGTTPADVYYGWSAMNWNFGTDEQYPILKYSEGDDADDPACGVSGKPSCDRLLRGQFFGLDDLAISSGMLSRTFNPRKLNYDVNVAFNVDEIVLHTTATGASIEIVSNRGEEYAGADAVNATIPLTIIGDTEITITVSAGDKATQYTVTLKHDTVSSVTIPQSPENIFEGRKYTPDFIGDLSDVTYRWQQTVPPSQIVTSDPTYPIPTGFVEAEQTTRTLKLILAVRDGSGIARSEEAELTVQKINNGAAAITTTLTGLKLTAAIIKDDPDGGQSSDIRYQWQRLDKTDGWQDIVGATDVVYQILDITAATRYRMKMRYIDGQGYCYDDTDECEKPIYSDIVRDIDWDNDGLIEILKLEELDAIRHQLDGRGYKASGSAAKITTGCPDSGCKGYELDTNLDFNDDASYNTPANRITWTTSTAWQPIGSADEPFSATFAGNGYTISNLTINRSTSHIGLFAKTSAQSTITHVVLLYVNIVGREVSNIADKVVVVGGLVGDNEGTIKHSLVDGTVEGTVLSLGGIAGMNGGRIEYSRAFGTVEGTNQVGGLVGQNNSGGTIKHSYAANDIMGGNSVGGLVGINSMGRTRGESLTTASIIYSHATGKVEGAGSVGGLVGSNLSMGEIINSHARGDVEASGSSIGGLVGLNSNRTMITKSYATGNIKATAGNNIGGLVGFNNNGGILTDSYATGNIITRGKNVGGLVGHNDGNGLKGRIENSYSFGVARIITGTSYVGALVGKNDGDISGNNATTTSPACELVGQRQITEQPCPKYLVD